MRWVEHQLSVIEIKPYRERQKRTLYPPKESNRDRLCSVIDNILAEKPKDYEEFLQKLEQQGYEVKRGKYTSVKGARQKRFIRFRTLGVGYSEEELKAVLAGEAEHRPRQKCPAPEQKFQMLVDIQAKLAEGKGTGFARWAKQHNLKEISRTLVFLQENKIGSIEEMQERVDAATARYHELGDSIKASEKRLAEIAVLKAHIINYAKTRPVYDAYYAAKTPMDGTWQGHAVILGLYAVLFILLGKTYDAFWMSMQRVSELMYGQVLAAMATDGIFYIVICLMATKLCNLLPGIAAIAGQFVMAGIWSAVAHRWYYKAFPPQPTTVVYDVRRGMEKLIRDYGLDSKYEVRNVLSVEECLKDLSVLDGMKTVFLSGVHSHERNIILKYCVMNDINTFIIPRVGDVLMSGAWPMHMLHLPVLRVGRYMAKPEYLFVKRAMDIVLSLVALIILSPVFLITTIAVKSDGGPAFYKQVRLTKDGKPFEILKFRSMRVDAEKDGVARLSTGDKDDRITKVGHIIRACRLDELPQLVNILKGDLSIVGPRPERPEIAAQYCEEMPEFALRLQAKAGLTGYAQVYGKYNTTPYDKLQMDLMYIAHPSLVEDLKIMLATVKILFMPESTEGISEGQTTAMSGENH